MEKIKVIVIGPSGAVKEEAELCLSSGVIKFPGCPASFSHISGLVSQGKTVIEKLEIIAPIVIKEEIKAPVSVVRSPVIKKAKKKG